MVVIRASKSNKVVTLWIMLGIPVIFAFSSLLHFVYDWTNDSVIAGIFSPVNESVWEHLKMPLLPMLLWWMVGFILLDRKYSLQAGKWMVSYITSFIVCTITVLAFFYTYTGAFGIESLLLDIFSLLLGITAGQLLALHIYRQGNPGSYCVFASAILFVLIVAAFVYFTFEPPKIPLFLDTSTGKYGI